MDFRKLIKGSWNEKKIHSWAKKNSLFFSRFFAEISRFFPQMPIFFMVNPIFPIVNPQITLPLGLMHSHFNKKGSLEMNIFLIYSYQTQNIKIKL